MTLLMALSLVILLLLGQTSSSHYTWGRSQAEPITAPGHSDWPKAVSHTKAGPESCPDILFQIKVCEGAFFHPLWSWGHVEELNGILRAVLPWPWEKPVGCGGSHVNR